MSWSRSLIWSKIFSEFPKTGMTQSWHRPGRAMPSQAGCCDVARPGANYGSLVPHAIRHYGSINKSRSRNYRGDVARVASTRRHLLCETTPSAITVLAINHGVENTKTARVLEMLSYATVAWRGL
jgi:hypothetical protein